MAMMKQSFSGEIDRFGAVSNMTIPLMTWTPALAGPHPRS
jgi:hypothetical protein